MPDEHLQALQRIEAGQRRIETKMDVLLAVLAEDEEGEPLRTLDGAPAGRERDQTQSLG